MAQSSGYCFTTACPKSFDMSNRLFSLKNLNGSVNLWLFYKCISQNDLLCHVIKGSLLHKAFEYLTPSSDRRSRVTKDGLLQSFGPTLGCLGLRRRSCHEPSLNFEHETSIFWGTIPSRSKSIWCGATLERPCELGVSVYNLIGFIINAFS